MRARNKLVPNRQMDLASNYTMTMSSCRRKTNNNLEVVWANPGVADLTQSAHMVTFIEMPWIGMETEACPYLDGGKVGLCAVH